MGAEQQLGAYNTASAKTLTILYVNSVNCVPIVFLVVLMSGEFHSLTSEYPHWHEPGFLFALTVVTSFACVFRFFEIFDLGKITVHHSYSIFLCTTVNSALTTACVGVIKSALTTIIGNCLYCGKAPDFILYIRNVHIWWSRRNSTFNHWTTY